jgi:ribosomal protein S27E
MNKMNPLSQYSKIEVLFTKLISNDVIKYPAGVITNTKCGVCARSARDEILLNTAAALIGGDAIAKVIENCVPNIEDGNELYVNDVEQLLIAIKIATGDESYDMNVTCPECEHVGGFSRDLNYLLNSATSFEEQPFVSMDNGLTVYFRPQTWREYSDFSSRMFEQHSRSRVIDNSDISEEEKQEIFVDVFEKMTQLNYDMICTSIERIVTPDDQIVTDQSFISDWVGTLSKKDLKVIRDASDSVVDIGVNHTMDVECSKCNHEWELTGLRYDPASFFGLDFSSANQKKSKK